MSMFDSVDGLLGGEEASGDEKLTLGRHKCEVIGVFPVEEKQRVDVKVRFANNAVRRIYLYFKSKQTIGWVVKQLNAAGFSGLTSGEKIKEALDSLTGITLLVEVTNRKGSDYQNFVIVGADSSRQSVDALDDDVPF